MALNSLTSTPVSSTPKVALPLNNAAPAKVANLSLSSLSTSDCEALASVVDITRAVPFSVADQLSSQIASIFAPTVIVLLASSAPANSSTPKR